MFSKITCQWNSCWKFIISTFQSFDRRMQSFRNRCNKPVFAKTFRSCIWNDTIWTIFRTTMYNYLVTKGGSSYFCSPSILICLKQQYVFLSRLFVNITCGYKNMHVKKIKRVWYKTRDFLSRYVIKVIIYHVNILFYQRLLVTFR